MHEKYVKLYFLLAIASFVTILLSSVHFRHPVVSKTFLFSTREPIFEPSEHDLLSSPVVSMDQRTLGKLLTFIFKASKVLALDYSWASSQMLE